MWYVIFDLLFDHTVHKYTSKIVFHTRVLNESICICILSLLAHLFFITYSLSSCFVRRGVKYSATLSVSQAISIVAIPVASAPVAQCAATRSLTVM